MQTEKSSVWYIKIFYNDSTAKKSNINWLEIMSTLCTLATLDKKKAEMIEPFLAYIFFRWVNSQIYLFYLQCIIH